MSEQLFNPDLIYSNSIPANSEERGRQLSLLKKEAAKILPPGTRFQILSWPGHISWYYAKDMKSKDDVNKESTLRYHVVEDCVVPVDE